MRLTATEGARVRVCGSTERPRQSADAVLGCEARAVISIWRRQCRPIRLRHPREPIGGQTRLIYSNRGRALRVGVGIRAPVQPNRIALHIPSNARIVIAEVVVMQPRFRIVVLTGKTQIEGE